jgi:phosphatidate phosphatase APP1
MLKLIFTVFLIFNLHARTVVISDIDDTIRQTNVLSKVKAVRSVLMDTAAFPALAEIYQQLNFYYSKSPIKFFYLSAAPECLIEHDDWAQRKLLPLGRVFQRPCNYTWLIKDYTAKYKYRTISNIIQNDLKQFGQISQILLFGDNAEHDPEVYRKIKLAFAFIDIKIFIRDIRVEATKVDTQLSIKTVADVNYFLTELDLLKFPTFQILPVSQRAKIIEDFKTGKLYPKYLYRNLARRYEQELGLSESDAMHRSYQVLISNLRY